MGQKVRAVLLFVMLLPIVATAQNVGINDDGSTADPSAILDVKSTDKGILIPRVALNDTATADPVTAPAEGLLIYNQNGSEAKGFYYWNGSYWKLIGGATAGSPTAVADTLPIIMDADGNTAVTTEQNANENIIRFHVDGTERWRMDGHVLEPVNSGNSVFIGDSAGANDNLATNFNTFVGWHAGSANTIGNGNVAIGTALGNNIDGDANVAIGNGAMSSNTSGWYNVAVGGSALRDNTTGYRNTAVGMFALYDNTTGRSNIAMGNEALTSNTIGRNNVALGNYALYSNTTGDSSTAVGYYAGVGTNGHRNVFLGSRAGHNSFGDDQLYIENTSSAFPLIYGDFAADILQFNGTVTLDGDAGGAGAPYTLPAQDGTANQYMQTDGSGNLSWVNNTAAADTMAFISDDDRDTYVTVEQSPDEDTIRFGVAGLERWTMGGLTFAPMNSGLSVHIGENSGAAVTGAVRNTAVGYNTLANATSGGYNVAIGNIALEANSTGQLNTALGHEALAANTGSDNIGVGRRALRSNTSGTLNLGVGADVLYSNTIGNNNNAMGFQAMAFNVAGQNGTAIGHQAMLNGFNGGTLFNNHNVAVGFQSLMGSAAAGSNTGNANTAVGYATMVNNSTGSDNVAVGDSSMFSNSAGNFNVSMGAGALQNSNASENTAVGFNALHLANSGGGNSAYGRLALYNLTSGSLNTVLGAVAGYGMTTGGSNTVIGHEANVANGDGDNNVIIGRRANRFGTTGDNNVVVGYEAGRQGGGTGNVFLGYQAGYSETGSSKLYIEYGSGTTPLIYGDFASNQVGIDRVPTNYTFEISGDASKAVTGSWQANSDQRLKKNISYLGSEQMLQKVLDMKGVTYEWNDTATGYQRPEGTMYGFIAQDLQKVWPDKVKEDNLGYLTTAYGDYDPMFVESIKALVERDEKQHALINELLQTVEAQSKALAKLDQRMSKRENRMLSRTERRAYKNALVNE